MPQITLYYVDPVPPHTRSGLVTLNPALAKMTQPRLSPIQKVSIAESGEVWVYQLSSSVELELTLELMDIPTTTRAFPEPHDGVTQLAAFLQSSINWSQFPFVITDPDGDSFTVRYMTGFETMVEAAGRAQKVDSWSGTLILRRVI